MPRLHLLPQKVRHRLNMQVWRESHPGATSKYSKVESRNLKLQTLNHYSSGTNSCALCGFNNVDALAIDHINGKGNEERRKVNKNGGIAFYRYLRQNDYPTGYRVLCWNCNHLEHVKTYGDPNA